MNDQEKFPGTPMDGSIEDDVDKDSGGIGMPTGPTTGIQTYDLEGARVKKPKTAKRKIKPSKGPQKRPTNKTPIDVKKEESDTAPYDDFDDTDDVSSKSAKVDITKFEQPALEKFYNDNKAFFDSEELVKGVCDVASLGNLISQLSWMADSQAMERQIEGDTSKIPEELRAESAKLLGILSDMASEESEEITNGTTAEDVMRQTQPTMSPGLYRADISSFAKALRDSLGLAKVGARNSAKDMETIQKVHDAACELGANCSMQNGSVDKLNGDDDMKKADTIMAEGNKRGAAVTDPSPGINSSNAEWTDDSSDQGQEKQSDTNATKKGKKRMDMDMDMAAKGKKRADMDMDMDDSDDDDDWDDDDSDDDEDVEPKAKKAKKAKKFDSDDLAKAVAAGVKAAFAEINGGRTVAKGNEMTIPRVAPKLMAVGKGGDVSTSVDIDLDELKKSVSPVNARSTVIPGDNDTARLIKAIHAAGPTFRLNPNDIPST